jgi:antitoxin component of MazEF toxin-antitoxin module
MAERYSLKSKIRKITKTGAGLSIGLPREFVREHDLKPGDEVVVAYNGVLQAIPIKEFPGLKKNLRRR